uniref:IstB-like ATP binding N-terminal n=1 Tax=Candidatus Kentrum sp. LFY TaxID=2126342 RepID=A0A450UXV0_9GAMM|nr:MAG: IstB-like ATP binding N-terminal [Candidatus Kentron sp. LFY]
MLQQQTLDKLRSLRLVGIAQAFEQQLTQPATQELAFEDRFGLLVEQEILHQDNRRMASLLKAAKLRISACVEDIDYRHPRGIERSAMSALTSSQWIIRHRNLGITGPTGSGKTWLACALGNQACRQGLSVRYFRVPRLFESLRIAHADGTYPRFMNQLAKAELLILDDWGNSKNDCPTAQRSHGGDRRPPRPQIDPYRLSATY